MAFAPFLAIAITLISMLLLISYCLQLVKSIEINNILKRDFYGIAYSSQNNGVWGNVIVSQQGLMPMITITLEGIRLYSRESISVQHNITNLTHFAKPNRSNWLATISSLLNIQLYNELSPEAQSFTLLRKRINLSNTLEIEINNLNNIMSDLKKSFSSLDVNPLLVKSENNIKNAHKNAHISCQAKYHEHGEITKQIVHLIDFLSLPDNTRKALLFRQEDSDVLVDKKSDEDFEDLIDFMSTLDDLLEELEEEPVSCATIPKLEPKSMEKKATKNFWQATVWGSPCPAGDMTDHYHFSTKDLADKCAARKITEGWDVKSIEVVEIEEPPPRLMPTPQIDKEEFLQWLEKRMESVGYSVDSAPSYLKDAYLTGNPSDLNPLVWHEWLRFKSPNGLIASGEVDPPAFIGPRGGTYTMDANKDGRPYRRYF